MRNCKKVNVTVSFNTKDLDEIESFKKEVQKLIKDKKIPDCKFEIEEQ